LWTDEADSDMIVKNNDTKKWLNKNAERQPHAFTLPNTTTTCYAAVVDNMTLERAPPYVQTSVVAAKTLDPVASTATTEPTSQSPTEQPLTEEPKTDKEVPVFPKLKPGKVFEQAMAAIGKRKRDTVPVWARHGEIAGAMQAELDGWKDRGVYSLVSKKEAQKAMRQGRGQLLPLRWVITEKCDPDPRVKARLVVRGDKDRRTDVLTDAPTAPQHILRCALLASVCHGRDLITADVGQAFLNASMTDDMDIYGPVAEANPAYARRFALPDDVDPDHYWKMDKAGYGLQEAGLLWYLHLVNKVLIPQGWRRSHAHPCLFLKKNASLVTYVDDLLAAGVRSKLEQLLKDMGLDFRHVTIVDHHGTTFAGVEIRHYNNEVVLGMEKYAARSQDNTKTKDSSPIGFGTTRTRLTLEQV